jgi:hypothetical protein
MPGADRAARKHDPAKYFSVRMLRVFSATLS